MQSVRRIKAVAVILACAAMGTALLVRPLTGIAADAPMDASVPTTQPAAKAVPQRSVQDISAEYGMVNKQLSDVLPKNIISDGVKRNDAAPKAIPILYHRLRLVEELAATKKSRQTSVVKLKLETQALLYLLNDVPTVTKVKEMIASKDTDRQIEGQSINLFGRWLGDGDDKLQAKSIVDQVEKLDRANPADLKLTMLTLDMADSTESSDISDRLIALITDVKTDSVAAGIKSEIAEQKAAEAKIKADWEGKPMDITGKTVDGKDFSSADYRGKVVMVDFWATWCGPCVAGLPHVKDVYAKYHDKGLEIVGVSNDQKASDLTTFTQKQDMAWVQLLEFSKNPNNRFSPITQKYGIQGIPTLFLIDKKGVCRSVTAREDMDVLIPKLLAE